MASLLARARVVLCDPNGRHACRELGLICHEPTRLEIAAERAMLAQLLTPPAADSDGEQSGSDSRSSSGGTGGNGAATSTVKGISSVTGLPLLPSFAIACHAGFDPHDGVIRVEGLVASEDGRLLQRVQASGGAGSPADAEAVGREVGQQLRDVALQHGWLDDL